MKNMLPIAVLCLSTSAFATIDSYTTVTYPVEGMQEPKVCMVESLAHDGISNMGTAQTLAVSALNMPFKIVTGNAGVEADDYTDANLLSGKGVKLGFEFDWESDLMNKGTLRVDASEGSARAKTREEREELVRMIKVAIYSGVTNSLNGVVTTLKVELKGLPDQSGIKSPVPSSFKSAFSAKSPYLASLKKELKVVDGIKKCN